MPPIPTKNTRLVLAERPARGPITDKTFRQESTPIPELKDGEILVRVDYVSIDPTMRNWLNDARSYMEPVKIGAVMRSGGIGRVVASRSKDLSPGDLVQGSPGWQEYWITTANKVELRQTPPGGRDIDHLGLYGIAGITAYFGIFDIGRIKDGDTVVISGAAGSVGLIVTAIALSHPKCKVIAIAGSADKCESLKKMGCHFVLNYKDPNFKKDFRKVGLVDLYFDNVGGEMLDMVMTRLAMYGRIVACGAIASYNAEIPYGLRNTATLVAMRGRMEGFIAFDYAKRYPEARAYLADMKRKGKINYEYTVLEPKEGGRGLERCTEALEVLYSGKNYGKTLVKISGDETRAKL